MKNFILKKWSLFLVLSYVILVSAYALLNGTSSIWFQIHDNLDSNVVQYKMLRDNEGFFNPSTIIPFLGGSVYASGIVSPLKLINIPFLLFEPDVAMVVNYIVSIIIAIIGGVLLGKEILSRESWSLYKHLIILVSFCFGILPVFPATQICSASLPFLFWALYRLYVAADRKILIVVFLYPALSSFALFEIFICGFILAFFLFSSLYKKNFQWIVLISLFVFIGGMFLFDWNTFYTFLFSDTPSIRSSMQSTPLSLEQSLQEAFMAFTVGQYHSASSHTLIVLPVCTIFFFFLNYKYTKQKTLKLAFKDPFNWLYLWCIFNALVYGFDDWAPLRNLVATYFSPLAGFSFARTLWFNGFIWYFMFAIVLVRLAKLTIKHKWIISYLAIFAALLCIILVPQTYNHVQLQLKNIYLQATNQVTDFTFEEFYSPELFDEIKKDINYQNEWSITVGMHPAVLEYNGIATLDGYLSSYPQYYKDQFGKLIEPELKINPNAKSYFENWGGRAYVFNSELSYEPSKQTVNGSIKLNINPKIFKEMNGTYIFSRAEISNHSELGFSYVGKYSSSVSPYIIFVYKN